MFLILLLLLMLLQLQPLLLSFVPRSFADLHMTRIDLAMLP